MNNYCIVTTINKPTKAIEKLYEKFGENLIIVGDKKTPENWSYKSSKYIPASVNEDFCRYNHYTRKNIGYIEAVKNKASLVLDIDDDNTPNKNWKIRSPQVDANESIGGGWYNVYDVFSEEYIWPRGFSLKNLNKFPSVGMRKFRISSIQQGLADGDPDVDAIWRLVLKKEHSFKPNKSVYLQPNTWCPFNSQSTWFFPKAYPLMYLPVTASFRMTDIWRSFVAQKCLWELGEGVTFHSPSEVFQDRNEHDLLKDFEDEIPGYLKNDLIVETLSELKLNGNVCENLLTCYESLVDKDILPESEISSVKAWIKDYEKATKYMG
jgi:hypothetical protein